MLYAASGSLVDGLLFFNWVVMSSFHFCHLDSSNFHFDFGGAWGVELSLTSMKTGRWSLPQYGPVTIVVRLAMSGVHSVRSIVALRLSNKLGLVPRFFGVARMNLLSLCR